MKNLLIFQKLKKVNFLDKYKFFKVLIKIKVAE